MSAERPNVVLLIVDSLRADYLSCYGADRETPAFDDLAERGTRFETAYSSGPGTPISHAAMFTGRHPSETGNVISRVPVPEDIPIMAEWLHDAGYETVGFAGPSLMDSEFGYARGFDHYYEPYEDFFPKSLSYVRTALSDRRLTEPMAHAFYDYLTTGYDDYTKLKLGVARNHIRRSERPQFVMANLLTPHLPYDPPRPYKREATPELERPRLGIIEQFGSQQSVDDPAVRDERIQEHIDETGAGISKYIQDPRYYNEAELELLKDWYYAAIRYTGDQIRAFVRSLEGTRGLEDTVFMVTSDHGDFIGEHGQFGHAQYLHEEVTRIPLLVFGPGIPEGVSDDRLASHVDFFATVCDLADLNAPETSGLSLFGEATHDAVFSEHGVYMEERETGGGIADYLSEERTREVTAGRKTVRTRDHRFELVSDGDYQLYTRPGDEAITDESVAEVLRQLLLETLGEEFHSREGAVDELDETIKANLRELGYI